MPEDFHIVYVEKPEESAWGIIGNGLDAFNKQHGGDYGYQRLCCVLQTPDGEIVGGVLGDVIWQWFHVDLLWVKEELRGQGYGGQLLAQAEAEARQRGAKHAFLDTFTFQAPEFYQRHGYRVFGELPDFPAGHTRYYLTKEL
jgi:ribosomal protein S18 acetylase RimI-like enzyme